MTDLARCDSCGSRTHQPPHTPSGILLCSACAAEPDDTLPLTDDEVAVILKSAGIDASETTKRMLARIAAAPADDTTGTGGSR